MPNLIGPLLPSFGLSDESKKAVKKAELYALTYALAVTVAKAAPSTAVPIGFLTGLEVYPGKGIKVKKAAVPLLYAPQPVGAIPPHVYGLPDVIGEPLDLAKIAREPNSREALSARIAADEVKDTERRLAAQQLALSTATPYTREVFASLAAGERPRAPDLGDVLNVKFDDRARPVPFLPTLDGVPDASLSSVLASAVRPALDVVAALDAERQRTGSIPMVDAKQPTTGTEQVVGQIQRLDQFGRSNPPDP